MKKLIVKGKYFYAENKRIILKGIAIPDPIRLFEREKQTFRKALDVISQLGGTCVRIPILPGHFVALPNFLDEWIDPVVQLCQEKNLYCILDWHAIGNPLKCQTRLKEYFHLKGNKKIFWYESDIKLAKKGLLELAKRYGKKEEVLFEVYNEPAPGEKDVPGLGLSALLWTEWKKELENIISLIREHTDNLILVSPVRWASSLDLIAKDPIKADNIAYTFHVYPMITDWKYLLQTASKLPIIITECGFDNEKKSLYYGSIRDYAIPLMEYCTSKNISWTAWCLSISWRPRILLNWEPLKLTEFGEVILKTISRQSY